MFDHLSELDISRTVFHDVPSKRLQRDSTLELSDVETILDDTKRNLLRSRLVEGLQRRGYPIVIDTSIQSPVPPAIYGNLSGAGHDFVGVSQYIAQFLYEKQLTSSANGVLVMAECRLRSRYALALIKLEKASGFLPDRSSDGGVRRFNLEYAAEVLLTERVRILKAGLFALDGTNINGVVGLVVDNQIGGRRGRAAADYFLKQFLGCKLQDNPAQITKRCFDAASRWVDTNVEDAHDRFRYQTSLQSEMLRDVNTIELEQFAIEHLEIRYQSEFLKQMVDANVPTHSFLKDIEHIRHNLRRVQTEVADGIQVVTGADMSSSQVSMVVNDDGSTTIVVTPTRGM